MLQLSQGLVDRLQRCLHGRTQLRRYSLLHRRLDVLLHRLGDPVFDGIPQ
jgi:hypothetical protein